MCRENIADNAGKCITQSDIDELWTLYLEVRQLMQIYSTYHSYVSIPQDSKLGNFQRLIPARNNILDFTSINFMHKWL